MRDETTPVATEGTSSILSRWQQLEMMMEAIRAVNGLKTAVRSLEVIASTPGEAGDMAATAILNVLRELEADVDLDA